MRNTLSCIREINIFIIHLLIKKKYTFMYNKNKRCHYTRRYIIKIFIFLTHLLIKEK